MTLVDPKVFEKMVALRRDLHRHPELSWKEERTASTICQYLDELSIPYQRNVAGTGVVADIPGPKGVPKVALRGDMDALPIQEETGLEYTSIHPGIMHACGHDGHTAMVLGAAELLLGERELPAPIRLIFQPAEEKGAGAKAMIEQGVLDDVGMIYGVHVDRHYPTGQIVVTPGAVNASTDEFSIHIEGQGGHAARPHEGIDAVIVGSLIVMALQTIVSREVDPAHPSVLSIGKFEAGSAHNVIASRAHLAGTIRAQEKSVRDHLKQSLQRIAKSIGELHQAEIKVTIEAGTPPVVNRGREVDLARQAAISVVGEDQVTAMEKANMGGEDFGYYLEEIPGVFARLGAQLSGKESFPAHSSRFEWDEEVLSIGAAYFREIALIAGKTLQSEVKAKTG